MIAVLCANFGEFQRWCRGNRVRGKVTGGGLNEPLEAANAVAVTSLTQAQELEQSGVEVREVVHYGTWYQLKDAAKIRTQLEALYAKSRLLPHHEEAPTPQAAQEPAQESTETGKSEGKGSQSPAVTT